MQRLRKDESGMTLIELIVALAMGMIIFMMLTVGVIGAMHTQTRVSNRVHSTAKARTALHRVTNELHSSCVARYLTPIEEKSTGSELRFVRSYSAEVSPNPVESRVYLTGTTLTQSDYEVLSGSSPDWDFKTTSFATQAIMPGVAPISVSVPMFRYYAYNNGAISSTPLTVPAGGLTEAESETVVKVDIALKVTTPGTTFTDAKSAAQVQDSAYLRFTPPVYTTTGTNLPCE